MAVGKCKKCGGHTSSISYKYCKKCAATEKVCGMCLKPNITNDYLCSKCKTIMVPW